MNRIFLIILALAAFGCSKQIKEKNLCYSQLERTDLFLTNQIETVLHDLARAHATNMTASKVQFNKSFVLHDASTQLQDIINSDSILLKNNLLLKNLLPAFEGVIDSLKLSNKFVDELKKQYIDYWIQKDLPNPLSQDQVISIITDIKLLEYVIQNYLFKQIGENDFSFNVLKPTFIEKSNIIKKGDTYEAKICFTAFDTTRHPIVRIGDYSIVVEDGYGMYRLKTNKTGMKTISGVMIFQRNNYKLDTIPFEHTIFVK
jgi:hypothetical protein